MSPSELQQLESLLFRALPDPRGFADRVLEQLLDRLAADPSPARSVTVVTEAAQHLSDRDALLAAALGACECWGDDSDCAVCGGDGVSGWTEPDDELYATYVRPAVRRRAGTVSSAGMDSRPDRAAAQEGAQR